MKTPAIRFLVVLAVILTSAFEASSLCRAETAPNAASEFQAFATKQQSLLSELVSFEMKGTIKVTESDAYAKINSGRVVARRNFTVWGKGGNIKEIVESLSEAGLAGDADAYFLSASKVTVAHSGHRKTAKIFPSVQMRDCITIARHSWNTPFWGSLSGLVEFRLCFPPISARVRNGPRSVKTCRPHSSARTD